MASPSPLRDLYLDAGIDLAGFGPSPNPTNTPTPPAPPTINTITAAASSTAPELAMVVESLELEYAAIRKSCGLLDEPHRALIEVTGPDRLSFLNRMLTQELKGLGEHRTTRSFWLNRKGRIDADVFLINLPGRVWLDIDTHALARALDGLNSFIVMDDVALRDVSSSWHRLSLHGPTVWPLLADALAPAHTTLAREPLQPGHALEGVIQTAAGPVIVTIARNDLCGGDGAGVPGVSIYVPAGATPDVFQTLIERGHSHATPTRHAAYPHADRRADLLDAARDAHAPNVSRATDPRAPLHPALASLPILRSDGGGGNSADKIRLRLIGWHAFNIARVEAGMPLYLLDFGPDSLPHESGVLHSRVNFKKGCYLGQEIVARMESRGHSKGTLVMLRAVESYTGPLETRPLPEAGAAIHISTNDPAPTPTTSPNTSAASPSTSEPIGRITSSVLSPRAGSQPIAIAYVKPAAASPGTRVRVECPDAPPPEGTIEMQVGSLMPSV